METLKFSTNWNDKLFTKVFSTIRPYNPSIHILGNWFDVKLMQQGEPKHIKNAELIYIKPIKIDELPESICYLDTGYSKDETIKIFETMYKNKFDNVHDVVFAYMLFNTLKMSSDGQKH